MYFTKSFPSPFFAPTHVNLHKWMNDVLHNEFSAAGSETAHSTARANIREFSDRFEVEIIAPGMEKSDFSLSVEGSTLTVKAQKAQPTPEGSEAGKYTRREFQLDSVARSFTLPKSVDGEAIRASYQQGILTIAIPKREITQPTPRSVEVE